MKSIAIDNLNIPCRHYHTLIVGAGAAGMNCARKLCEFLGQAGVAEPAARIAVLTRGVALGASRMSGSDKQTYYKLGTSPAVADSALSFAASLTAGGCCHHDLALAEGLGSLRAFHSLVEAGVPFPHDALGAYTGYKTDHDPSERATSAGPRTSRYMSERLEEIVRGYGVAIHDRQEAVALLKADASEPARISGMLTLERGSLESAECSWRIFTADNIVLAAGGPGGLYETSVYPRGQTGMHGIALRAGLAAENLSESQFGLASTKFRWNVSGSYMQSMPRIYSTDADGGGAREFLAPLFPDVARMASTIFRKGYQWPLDAERINGGQSSLIDLAVHCERARGRRVFLDFRHNPRGAGEADSFSPAALDEEARDYMRAAGALQSLPIERLAALNPQAIEIYREHEIELASEPLEVAVCAQHCNGGIAVDHWWRTNIAHTFVIGEMAGTHGVKRPGGAALNAGQVGAQRAAEYIAARHPQADARIDRQRLADAVSGLLKRYQGRADAAALAPLEVLGGLRRRMSTAAGHIRSLAAARAAADEARQLCEEIERCGFRIGDAAELADAVAADHCAFAAWAFITAVHELLAAGSGSRGSHIVLDAEGGAIDRDLRDPVSGDVFRILPENESLRERVQRLIYDPESDSSFELEMLPLRSAALRDSAFETVWADFQAGRIYD